MIHSILVTTLLCYTVKVSEYALGSFFGGLISWEASLLAEISDFKNVWISTMHLEGVWPYAQQSAKRIGEVVWKECYA